MCDMRRDDSFIFLATGIGGQRGDGYTPSIDTQHIQYSCWFFMLERYKLCVHKPCTRHRYWVVPGTRVSWYHTYLYKRVWVFQHLNTCGSIYSCYSILEVHILRTRIFTQNLHAISNTLSGRIKESNPKVSDLHWVGGDRPIRSTKSIPRSVVDWIVTATMFSLSCHLSQDIGLNTPIIMSPYLVHNIPFWAEM